MTPELTSREAEPTEKEEASVAIADEATRETGTARTTIQRQRYIDHLHTMAELVWADFCREDER